MSTPAPEVTVSIEGRVATVELNRPEAMNAIDAAVRRALLAAFDELGRSTEVGAVVLTGAGKGFCAGADLKKAAANPDKSMRRTARSLLHDYQPLFECITRMEKPVIAAVNGGAVGIGMSLALACDLMIMADNGFLLSPFLGIGLIPDGGAAWFLTRRIGYGRAFELLTEGQKVGAARSLELGIANRIAPAEALRATAQKWAAELAGRAPMAMALTKRIARLSMSMTLSDALTLEAELQTLCASTEDAREAITAFSEKRAPRFTGR
jgi:2-(1,2-epoxy-1,2-dihydrophenyl)acetyl-CoA isomerase